MKRTLIALALAAGIAATPAFAATDTFKVDVDFNRAALDQPQTISAEYEKIHAQVAEKCEAEHADWTIAKKQAVAICTRRTMNRTVQKIGHDGLTAYSRDHRAN